MSDGSDVVSSSRLSRKLRQILAGVDKVGELNHEVHSQDEHANDGDTHECNEVGNALFSAWKLPSTFVVMYIAVYWYLYISVHV